MEQAEPALLTRSESAIICTSKGAQGSRAKLGWRFVSSYFTWMCHAIPLKLKLWARIWAFVFTLLWGLFLSYPLYSDDLLHFQNIWSAIQHKKEWQSLITSCKKLDSLNVFITKGFRQKPWIPKGLALILLLSPEKKDQKTWPKAGPSLALLNFMTTHLCATCFA